MQNCSALELFDLPLLEQCTSTTERIERPRGQKVNQIPGHVNFGRETTGMRRWDPSTTRMKVVAEQEVRLHVGEATRKRYTGFERLRAPSIRFTASSKPMHRGCVGAGLHPSSGTSPRPDALSVRKRGIPARLSSAVGRVSWRSRGARAGAPCGADSAGSPAMCPPLNVYLICRSQVGSCCLGWRVWTDPANSGAGTLSLVLPHWPACARANSSSWS
jgi:hypothetical protein